MIERIYLRKAKEFLHIKDNRTFRKLCFNNGITIFCDQGSNRPYIMADEFRQAYSKPIAAHVDRIQRGDMSIKYRPKGEHESKFLARLTKKLSEL